MEIRFPFSLSGYENEQTLGPPQTRPIVIDNYLVFDHKKLSITKKPRALVIDN